jgi:hypothetical protein
MMNNMKKKNSAFEKEYDGSNPADVREYLYKMGIDLPEGVNVTMGPSHCSYDEALCISSPDPEDASSKSVEQPKYIPNKPAVTFNNVTLYANDGNGEGSNEVRACFCDIADKYNASLMAVPEDIRSINMSAVRASMDNTRTIVRTIVSSFTQASTNLVWSLAKSVNDLAGNYSVNPFNFDDYDLNFDAIKYDLMNIIEETFRNDPKVVENIVNSGLLHCEIASAVNNIGHAVHNTFACNIIPRMIPYMTTKDAENFYKGFNFLFRMFMGDLNYEACVFENMLLADENPAVIMDNIKIADTIYNKSKNTKFYDEP